MKKISNRWGEQILTHTYPSIILNRPGLIRFIYFWNRATQLRNWYVGRSLRKMLRSGPRDFVLMDVGFGEGMYLLPCSKRYPNAHLEGIEKTLSHIHFTHTYRQKYELNNVSLYFQEVENLKRTHWADFVLCVGVLQYIEEDEKVLARLHQVLKPGGKCLLYIPVNGDFVIPGFGAFYEGGANYEKKQGRKRVYEPSEFLAKVKKTGFSIHSKTFTYGFWGKWTYEVYTFFLTLILQGAFGKKILGAIGMLLFLPIQWIGMLIDYLSLIKRGNGLLLIVEK